MGNFYLIVGGAAGALIGLQFVVMITSVAVVWGLAGLGGLTYGAMVARRMRLQSAYQPVLEDWLFHGWLPPTAYAVLALSAFAAPSHLHEALFGVAGAVLLLFIGIHNAWDAVAYLVNRRNSQGEQR